MNNELLIKVKQLPGPILVLGASGFVGANLFNMLKSVRDDVFGTVSRFPAWRLEDCDDKSSILEVDFNSQLEITGLLNKIQPDTVFDCITYGGYSFEEDVEKIYQTNLISKLFLINELINRNTYCYIHAGSSSEYGINSAAPQEFMNGTPNSHYSVTKCAFADRLYYAGKFQNLRCANLRLYSIYGPLEDSARLIPALIANCIDGKLPPLVEPEISRDFTYVDDACAAFVYTANLIQPQNYGESFNIGTGIKTTIRNLAYLAKDIYSLPVEPDFSTMKNRNWDTSEWYADTAKIEQAFGWKPSVTLTDGLKLTTEWYKSLHDKNHYQKISKKNHNYIKSSLSAIVACYKDEQAIPIMVDRLVQVFEKCDVDYEIILVNDCSPDNSEEVIRDISAKNPRVIGISHSRNFGSQAAFMSGMGISTKDGCILLDGDLQDPPELIESFIEKWQSGYEVVYGVRIKREAPLMMQYAYKMFYRLFDWFASIPIPHDAGDFSLLDRKVVSWLLKCKERDLFLRGVRAFVGFKQTGVPYVRPERMFGVSTNNLFKNIGWAKKGIFSFSRIPLDMVTTAGIILSVFSLILVIVEVIVHLVAPELAPKGVTTIISLIMLFGSFTILTISILGEYIAKIFEEVKQRPLFIRKQIIQNGKILPVKTD